MNYVCCGSCRGLFEMGGSTFDLHKNLCSGNVEDSDCDFVACKKVLYLSRIAEVKQEIVKTDVIKRGRPKGSLNKPKPATPQIHSDAADQNNERR